MGFLHRSASHGIAGLLAAIPSVSSNCVKLIIMGIVMIVVFGSAYRVWQEIHDVEDPDSPGELLDSFEQAHAEGELDVQELARLRKLLLEDQPAGGDRRVAPASPGSAPGRLNTSPMIAKTRPIDSDEVGPYESTS
jgi:hypothetical protein